MTVIAWVCLCRLRSALDLTRFRRRWFIIFLAYKNNANNNPVRLYRAASRCYYGCRGFLSPQHLISAHPMAHRSAQNRIQRSNTANKQNAASALPTQRQRLSEGAFTQNSENASRMAQQRNDSFKTIDHMLNVDIDVVN